MSKTALKQFLKNVKRFSDKSCDKNKKREHSTKPSSSRKALVTIRNLHKSFGPQKILSGLDLDVAGGKTVVILGPSGSGKSTLLRCINRLEKIDAGSIFVDGEQMGFEWKNNRLLPLSDRHVAKQRRSIGMVFQQFNLYPHQTALENIIEAPIHVHHQPRGDAVRLARDLLVQVGLADREDHYPSQLSGGQQQRVAIARALAIRPKLILFDEPTSALDPELIGEVLQVMKKLTEQGLTMIVVTHEIGFAREAADHVIFMADGHIVEQGSPEEVISKPQQPRTQEFLARFQSH